jgi:hypothetical protein
MRRPQRVQASGSVWGTLAISRAQLGEQRLRGSGAGPAEGERTLAHLFRERGCATAGGR